MFDFDSDLKFKQIGQQQGTKNKINGSREKKKGALSHAPTRSIRRLRLSTDSIHLKIDRILTWLGLNLKNTEQFRPSPLPSFPLHSSFFLNLD